MSLAEISATARASALGRRLDGVRFGGRALGRPVARRVRGRRRRLPLRVAETRLALLLRLGGFTAGAALCVGLTALLLGLRRRCLLLGLGGGLPALLLPAAAARL